jgi:hypothetical protein
VWIIKNKNRVRSEANYETDVLFTLLAGKCNVMHVWGSMSCVIDNEHLLKQYDKISSTSWTFNHIIVVFIMPNQISNICLKNHFQREV